MRDWLQKHMLSKRRDPVTLAKAVAKHFGGNQHGSHGRRIDRNEAKRQQLEIIDLEDDQNLQEEILTLYHLSTIAFEMGLAAKSVTSSNGRLWIGNMEMKGGAQ